MATKEELLERAQELDVDGRSGMNKAELEAAVAKAEEAEAGDSEEAAERSDAPDEEAVEEAADDQEELREEREEQGLDADQGEEAPAEADAEEREAAEAAAGGPNRLGQSLEHDFAPGSKTLEREDEVSDPAEMADARPPEEVGRSGLGHGSNFGGGGAADEDGNVPRAFGQKGVFYTDGLSGAADHNLERAYQIPEVLQSSDPEVRAAGDENEPELSGEEKELADRATDGEYDEAKEALEEDKEQ